MKFGTAFGVGPCSVFNIASGIDGWVDDRTMRALFTYSDQAQAAHRDLMQLVQAMQRAQTVFG